MIPLQIGTAGWAIPRAIAERFPEDGGGLERYAARFNAAEINSTFYRSHRPATYARWRDSTPPAFRFAVKCPRAITHDAKLLDTQARLERFLSEAGLLGEKLGPVLVQLPPSLAFDAAVAERFFSGLRAAFAGGAACEPRHPSWFEAEADALLEAHRVARVAADPARHPMAGEPGGWRGLAYWRLHGSPVMYRSAYDETRLRALAERLCAGRGETWCVFDNTTTGAAAANALDLKAMIARCGDSRVFGG
ncbi:MAG TPA: DUF72 domain-containing protein [Caulobacteraceae bacterium]